MRIIVLSIHLLVFSATFAAPTNYFDLPPQRFALVATQQLNLSSINYDLLTAAVLRETNERRRQHGLPELKHEPKASQAAKIQSDIMSARGSISHENPNNPRYKTPADRARAAGLNFRLVAENVATAFALQYQSGKPFYTERAANGRTILTSRPGGPEIPPHTYATFAKAFVDGWMNSKGHRENILLKEAQYLGAYCAPAAAPKQNKIPILYSTQVFFTPTN
jgi:uncharacterized protein YkwD